RRSSDLEGAHARVRPHHVQRDRRPSASSTGGHRSVTTLHVSDALPAQADLHLVGDAQLHLVIFQGGDFPVNAANRNNLVADLEAFQHFLALLLLLHLRADQEKVKHRKHEDKGQQRPKRPRGRSCVRLQEYHPSVTPRWWAWKFLLAFRRLLG